MLPPVFCITIINFYSCIVCETLWLTHLITYVPHLIDPALGTTHPCGEIPTSLGHGIANTGMPGDMFPQWGTLAECWLLSTWIKSVLSCLKWDMTTWTWHPAVNFRAWVASRKLPCSLTMSSSIRHMCDLPLWKHCSTTSVSTSITPGIASWNTRPWTFVGKTSPATPSSCGTSTSCSTCFMNTAHAGLRVKNVESCSPTKLARLWIQTNPTSCGWVATKHSPTATCSRDLDWKTSPRGSQPNCLHFVNSCCTLPFLSFLSHLVHLSLLYH